MVLKFRLLIFCFLFLFSATAQTPRIDSLQKVLVNSREDTLKALTLIDLCATYRREINDIEKVQENAGKLLNLSQKLNYKNGKAYAYYNIATVSWTKGDYLKSIDYSKMGLRLMSELGDKRGMAGCYNNLGNVQNELGNYRESLDYTFKANKLFEEINDKRGVANTFSNAARTYYNLGMYPEALTYNFKALKIRERLEDKLGTSISYNNLGIVFESQANHKQALDYYKKSLNIKQEIDDKYGMGMTYNNMANTYTELGNYQEALINHLQALKMREEMGDKQGIAMSNLNIGNLYEKQNKLKDALNYFKKSLKIYEDIGEKSGLIETNNGLGTCYEKQENYTEALHCFSRALKIAKEIDFKEGIRDAYMNLSSVNEKLGNYKEALEYNKLFAEVKDALLNEKSTRQMAELNTRFETDKKEKEIELLTKDQLLTNKTLKEQRIVRIGLISGLILLIILSFTLYNRFRFKQKANLLLEKQKEEIHKKNVLITDSIDYAKTIQEAILPDEEKLDQLFPEHFILYKPKSIVSGDFYWTGKKDDKIICAVADCTGHGVPGAFMSILGYNMLENAINRNDNTQPGAMLTSLNQEIVQRLSKGTTKETVKHGMDIALITIDRKKREIQYAGARNSLYLVREGTLTEIKADKMSTGIVSRDSSIVQYTNNTYEFKKGDMIYMFSDGFPDQKGEKTRKKFYYQPFKDLLVSIHQLTVQQQKMELDTTICQWMGGIEQTDDILIMGIRV